MTPKTFIRKILVSTCVVATLISVFFYFLAAIVNKVESLMDETAVTFRQFLLILFTHPLHSGYFILKSCHNQRITAQSALNQGFCAGMNNIPATVDTTFFKL